MNSEIKSNAHEAAVDTEIATRYEVYHRALDRLAQATAAIHYSARDRRVNRGEWEMTLAQAVCADTKRSDHAENIVALISAGSRALQVATDLGESNAKYEGWSRFFLVTGSNGHIHSSMHCSTCFPTTTYAWLPQLSGLSEGDAVAAHGPRLCSFCFPTAPVEWTLGIPREAGCPGSGKFIGYRQRYVKCPECGLVSAVTSGGKIRKHNPKAPKPSVEETI